MSRPMNNVRRMLGPHRIPTMLKRADPLCREAAESHARKSDLRDR